jgi:2-keto-4-pentenoate hydratase/2-oxohepta-3-ene-1,7-dioic acid hydratase in catechol pathway
MKYASYVHRNRHSWGVVDGEHIADIGGAAGTPIPTLRKALARPSAQQAIATAVASAPRLKLSEVTLEPVIPDPDKIICVGLNYENHRKETGRDVVQYPTLFTRFANSQIGQRTKSLPR